MPVYIHSRAELTEGWDLSSLKHTTVVLPASGNSGFAGCSWDDQICQYVHLDLKIIHRDYYISITEFLFISKWMINFHLSFIPSLSKNTFLNGMSPQEGRNGKEMETG